MADPLRYTIILKSNSGETTYEEAFGCSKAEFEKLSSEEQEQRKQNFYTDVANNETKLNLFLSFAEAKISFNNI